MDDHVGTFGVDSENYALSRPSYPDELYGFLAGKSPSSERAWDCAAGPGVATRGLIALFDEVFATDLNQSQLDQIPTAPGVRTLACNAETPPFPDDFFDLICVAQAIHWFDLDRFYPEASRVLKTDGVFAAWGYGDLSVDEEVDAVIDETVLTPLEPYWSTRIDYISTRYATLPFPFLEVPAPPFRMSQSWTRDQTLGYMATWSAYKRHNAETGANLLDACRKALQSIWPGEEQREVTFTSFIRAGLNRNA